MVQSKTCDKGSKEEFLRRKVMTIDELLEIFGCSLRTMQRRLHAWQTLSSYNHNGRYYTLPNIPRFDSHGLWHYQGISFSRQGSLKKTLVHLVKKSANGLSASEIRELLGVNPRSFLSHFQNDPELYREKIGGRYIWFGTDASIRNKQLQARVVFEDQVSVAMLPDSIAVEILIDLLHYPDSGLKNICRRLNRDNRGLEMTVDTIRAFLEMHDLQKKIAEPN